MFLVRVQSSSGSSPRVRGKLGRNVVVCGFRRIIPASAGQTPTTPTAHYGITDHPRECGANFALRQRLEVVAGSSPRVRGKRPATRQRSTDTRIIPASAGQTARPRAPSSTCADHPRECGANVACIFALRSPDGSSPRVRGKPHPRTRLRHRQRIIPASAGQTSRCPTYTTRWTDHPRECGANRQSILRSQSLTGSSPRVRGKLPVGMGSGSLRRIIPASAGQTRAYEPLGPFVADHPRECGANWLSISHCRRIDGSSPRVRGKRVMVGGHSSSSRIIPASAGQTAHCPTCCCRRSDHPRECGANTDCSYALTKREGSSPRVRGKQISDKNFSVNARIIPASAGQTPTRGVRGQTA